MNNPRGDCVLLFVRHPEKGKVKRRLAAQLGEEVTLELYRSFILDTLSTVKTCEVEFLICVYPPDSRRFFKEWLGSEYLYLPQQGEDLGQRMKNSFIDAFERTYRRVLIIGSDIPDLPGEFIKEALSYLTTKQVVIGPSADGGYYLIGFHHNSFLPEAFEGIPWGTHTVLQDTVHILKGRGLSPHFLPRWSDIDTYDDLKSLMERGKSTPFRRSQTFTYYSTLSGVTR